MDHVVASKLVERIYECGLTGADWSGVLNDMADLARADVAWLVLALPDLGVNAVVAPRSDPDVIAAYQEHWWRKDPTIPATAAVPLGRITSLNDTGRDRFASSEFFGDFWRRSGHAAERLAVNLARGAGGMASVGVQPSRRSGSIEPELAETFAFLIPHLVRSVQVRCVVRRLELELSASRQSPGRGVLLVDAEGRLIVADDLGHRLMAESSAIREVDAQVVLPTPEDTARLHRLIQQCRKTPAQVVCAGSTVQIDREGPPLRIDVLPFSEAGIALGPEHARYPQATAMLVLHDPVGRKRDARLVLRRRFGLTPAEAEVALELMRGKGRAAVAQRLGVSLATVRTHMTHVFAKAGVSSQAALVSQIVKQGVDPDVAGP